MCHIRQIITIQEDQETSLLYSTSILGTDNMKDADVPGGPNPWLNQPVMLHSSRADNCKLTEAQCRYRAGYWRYWYAVAIPSVVVYCLSRLLSRYQADHVYALGTVYLLCAVIGVFAISNFLVRFAPERVKGTAAWRKTVCVSRWLAYRGYRFPVLHCWSPSVGVMALGIVGAVFFFGMFCPVVRMKCSRLRTDY